MFFAALIVEFLTMLFVMLIAAFARPSIPPTHSPGVVIVRLSTTALLMVETAPLLEPEIPPIST